MQITRQIIVFDADDIHAESAFWAGVLEGKVKADKGWHDVLDADGEWRLAVQHAPGLVRAQWPDGTPQQIHLDLLVDDITTAHAEVMALGATVVGPARTFDSRAGFQVYADPAGHPFCLCWGH